MRPSVSMSPKSPIHDKIFVIVVSTSPQNAGRSFPVLKDGLKTDLCNSLSCAFFCYAFNFMRMDDRQDTVENQLLAFEIAVGVVGLSLI